IGENRLEVFERVVRQKVERSRADALEVRKADERRINGRIQRENQKRDNEGNAEDVAVLCVSVVSQFSLLHSSFLHLYTGILSGKRGGPPPRFPALLGK